jgi:hypothetical protein
MSFLFTINQGWHSAASGVLLWWFLPVPVLGALVFSIMPIGCSVLQPVGKMKVTGLKVLLTQHASYI